MKFLLDFDLLLLFFFFSPLPCTPCRCAWCVPGKHDTDKWLVSCCLRSQSWSMVTFLETNMTNVCRFRCINFSKLTDCLRFENLIVSNKFTHLQRPLTFFIFSFKSAFFEALFFWRIRMFFASWGSRICVTSAPTLRRNDPFFVESFFRNSIKKSLNHRSWRFDLFLAKQRWEVLVKLYQCLVNMWKCNKEFQFEMYCGSVHTLSGVWKSSTQVCSSGAGVLGRSISLRKKNGRSYK